MCEHCHRDMTTVTYADRAFHDGWLYPHGRAGYSGVTPEMVAAAQASCPFCRPDLQARGKPMAEGKERRAERIAADRERRQEERGPQVTSEYDRRAEAWVRAKFGGDPDPGSVEFASDCAAYGFDGPVTASVSWKENGGYQSRELDVSAWHYDWTDIIRELLDIDLSTAGGTGRSAEPPRCTAHRSSPPETADPPPTPPAPPGRTSRTA